SMGQDELRLLTLLLGHKDADVKRLGIFAAQRIGKEHSAQVVEALRLVDLGEDSQLASALCSIFDERYGVPPSALTDTDIKLFLAKLFPVLALDRQVCEFLALAAIRLPDEVVEFLLHRARLNWRFDVNRSELPFDDDLIPIFKGLKESEALPRLLGKVV